ncbi:MAG: C10 family peptidase [Candidatus Symbiothrix sp.]|jgi:uncharacterized repeat protein (TIGR02543 family)|nr:C10 family peptidase [Candidatus Symbiothrix sp.]
MKKILFFVAMFVMISAANVKIMAITINSPSNMSAQFANDFTVSWSGSSNVSVTYKLLSGYPSPGSENETGYGSITGTYSVSGYSTTIPLTSSQWGSAVGRYLKIYISDNSNGTAAATVYILIKPRVTTGTATQITTTSAYLNGTATYCTNIVFYRKSGTSSWSSSYYPDISGLTPCTQYEYRVAGTGFPTNYLDEYIYGDITNFTTLSNTPSTPGSISGLTSVCAGGGSITYSISSVSGATSYTWTLPSGWSSSSTSTSISATPGSSASSGYIYVKANNSCGSSSQNYTYVTVNTPPTAPTSISGTTSITNGQNTTLTASGGSTGSGCTYQWGTGSCGSNIIAGQTSSSISVSPASTTTYWVRRVGTSPCGSTTTSCATQSIIVSAKTYTVVYNGNGNTGGSTASSSHTYDVAKNLTANGFTKTGYTFAGWATSATGSVVYSNSQSVLNLTATNGGTVNLYAKWAVNSCGVEPLLTTYWAQRAPYNNLVANLGGDYPTGCVATAMAQIMNYWGHPIQRTRSIPSYTTDGLHISVPAITGTTTYDWVNMKNTTAEYITTAQKNAVAKLMYECGVAVHMDYKPGGSGAYVLEDIRNNHTSFAVLPTYFGYDNTIQSKWRGNLNTEWDDLLISDLNAGRPILYIGYDPAGGHAFVCDGFSCNTDAYGRRYFHFNWGWGEAYQGNSNNANNGYFVSSALNISDYAFNGSQGIVYNIKPNSAAYIDPTNADGTSTFAISANALTGGYIIPEGTAIRYAGENQPVSFAANSGYEIDQVFIDGNVNATAKDNGYYIFSNVTANHSIIVTFKASSTGINNIQPQEKISIYPNPAKDEIFIQSETPIEKVEILDLSGHPMISTNSTILNVSPLPQGVYFVRIVIDGQSVTKKVIKE